MENQNKTFWCHRCCKKYFLHADDLTTVSRSELQKKLPFLDPENNNKSKSEMKSQCKIYKCKICGFAMREITEQQNAESNYDS